MDISPDFYDYFEATYPILHNDPTLWCVSAWNDNGKGGMVSNDPGQDWQAFTSFITIYAYILEIGPFFLYIYINLSLIFKILTNVIFNPLNS